MLCWWNDLWSVNDHQPLMVFTKAVKQAAESLPIYGNSNWRTQSGHCWTEVMAEGKQLTIYDLRQKLLPSFDHMITLTRELKRCQFISGGLIQPPPLCLCLCTFSDVRTSSLHGSLCFLASSFLELTHGSLQSIFARTALWLGAAWVEMLAFRLDS